MTVTKLALYNDALRLVGAERLASETEAREVRYKLDEIWDLGAAKHCFRIAKPSFARKTVKLDSPATITTHGLTNEHTLPTDYAATVEVFADEDLDQAVKRKLFEDDKIYTEISVVWLRYVRDLSSTFTNWTPDFARVVSAYLGEQLAARIKSDRVEDLTKNLETQIQMSLALSDEEDALMRPQKTLTTLTKEWLPIYNDALQMLGLRRMTTISDERADRTELDAALDSRLVEALFEDYPWNWARIFVKLEANTRLETSFGYQNVFEKPVDLLRLDGVFRDEYGRTPLKDYADQGRNLFCNDGEIYMKYVPMDYVGQPASWPAYFSRLVAALMAEQAEPNIEMIRPDVRRALPEKVMRRRNDATSNDFMQSPPQRINTGSWVRARQHGTRNSRDYG